MVDHVSRREFLRTGAVAAGAAAAVPALALGQEEKAEKPKPLPRRRLGRTGADVCMLNLGAAQDLNARMLNAAYDNGVHYFDTADCYKGGKSERAIAGWFDESGHREDIFLVTKDHPQSPEEWVEMADRRLEALHVDQIDLFFIHQLGDEGRGGYPEGGVGWPKMKEWAAAAEKMKKAGKIKFAGFSSHCKPVERRIGLLNDAVKGGWVDAIMVAADPTLIRENADFNKALDNCYKADVGLICMKEVRGGLAGIKEVVPELETKGLTPYTAVLSAIWSDERFASICSHMDNIKKLRENSDAARKFTPLTGEELGVVHRMLRSHSRRFCQGCDGSCQRAAGTQTAFADIARYLSYYEEDGRRAEAKTLFAALSAEQRDWSQADLCAASRACVSGLDFREILANASVKLA
ncbi:MAG: aldo/keto reductase [Planctomycetota bacterium]|jgi:predicted aldo/keto reductase-like oxidoreductase